MIVVLTGPTGSGKTRIAIELAKRINAEIVNADAFQIYEELSIATAKPSKEQLAEVKHHLIGFVKLTDSYDVHRYQIDCRNVINQLIKEGKNIIIAGGTGLYIRAALYNYKFKEEQPVDMSSYESMSNEELYSCLENISKTKASNIHQNNRQRVMRAIQSLLAGNSDEVMTDPKLLYDVIFYEIDVDREDLYPLVDQRVEEMFNSGLLDENKQLFDKYGTDLRSFLAIGVKETIPYFKGEASLESIKAQIKLSTRHYIKRQETFFRHQFVAKKVKNVTEIIDDLGVK